MSKTPEQALIDEFGAWYQLDELVDYWSESFFAEQAVDTAGRLLSDISPQDLGGLRGLLRALRDDPRHPLHRPISEACMVVWADPRPWPIFQKLMDDVLAAIDRATGAAEP